MHRVLLGRVREEGVVLVVGRDGRLGRVARLDGLIPSATWLTALDVAPDGAVLLRVRQRARVVRRDPRAEEKATLCAPGPLLLLLGHRPVATPVVHLVVVEEVEQAWLHDELGAELHANLLEGVEGRDLGGRGLF